MKFNLLALAFLAISSSAVARLGDTRDQLEARYGLPKKPTSPAILSPLVKGATEYTYEYQGWRIRCALLMAKDGRAYTVRQEYRKIWNTEVMKAGGSIQIKDFERDAVLAGEAGSRHWTQKRLADAGKDLTDSVGKQLALFSGLTGTFWVREDGALAHMEVGNSAITFELPQARKYEAELKAMEESKQRAALPKF